MESFVYENATRVYFGRGCVGASLEEAVRGLGKTVLLAYGGGSIKKNGIYGEVTGS